MSTSLSGWSLAWSSSAGGPGAAMRNPSPIMMSAFTGHHRRCATPLAGSFDGIPGRRRQLEELEVETRPRAGAYDPAIYRRPGSSPHWQPHSRQRSAHGLLRIMMVRMHTGHDFHSGTRALTQSPRGIISSPSHWHFSCRPRNRPLAATMPTVSCGVSAV